MPLSGKSSMRCPGHPDPVGAIEVMIRLGILVAELRGVLDANTVVRRADPAAGSCGGGQQAAQRAHGRLSQGGRCRHGP